jgi:hypothetical protein
VIVGLQAGFGDPLGGVPRDLRALGFGMVRLDMQNVLSPALFRTLVAEVTNAGMTPLCILSPERMGVIPDNLTGLDIEVLNEPDLQGLTPLRYVENVRAVQAYAAGRHRIWAGGVSNLTTRKVKWLREVVMRLSPEVGVTVHRYPKNGEPPRTAQDGFRTREEEMAAVRSIVGTRPWGCSECGYHTGPQSKGWWFWRRTWRWTDAQIGVFGLEEMRYWRNAGAAFAVWYQLNDGTSADPIDRFGIRRLDGGWKPVARTLAATPEVA